MMLQYLRLALCAIAITAACGGGDPPGGGNGNDDTDGGDTTDGTTGNGGTDGHVPNPNNPLIAVIPGMWEHYERDGQKPDNRFGSQIFVDPKDPDCQRRCADSIPPTPCPVGPPGDACISFWPTPGDDCRYLILEGSAVRARDYYFDCSGCTADTPPEDCYQCTNCDILGEVLNGGARVVFTITTTEVRLTTRNGEVIGTCGGDADCPSGTSACLSGYCAELLGTETHVDAFREVPP